MMVHVKSYETVFKFVKVTQQKP